MVHERNCKSGCVYEPLSERLCYFHQKVEAGLIDGYMDYESGTWVPLQTFKRDDLFDSHRKDVLNERGISDSLIDTEPLRYRSFEQGDWETFARLMGLTNITPWLKGKVSQSGGVTITRYGLKGRRNPSPYARFDEALYFGKPPRQPKFPGQGKTNYAYRAGDKTMHIDIHPLALPRLGMGEPLYFCLEGSLKADAVLSVGGLAISCTSVTTWNNPDLKRLLPALRSASVVYVVPDSDYYSSDRYSDYFNPMVRYQTMAAAQWLKTHGVNALIAVPWTGQQGLKTGIDDYLALAYPLGELTIENPFPPYPGLAISPSVRLTKSERRILDYLVSRNGEHGAFLPKEVGSAVALSRQTVLRTYKKLESLGIMRVWQGDSYLRNGQWGNEPHGFVMFGQAGTYREFLSRLAVPNKYAKAGVPQPAPGWANTSSAGSSWTVEDLPLEAGWGYVQEK